MPANTMKQAKAKFRREHPNLRVNGWDERDYKLWSALRQLPSYGLTPGQAGTLHRLCDILKVLEDHAEQRFEEEWRKSHAS